MDITAPYGFKEIVPLEKTHKVKFPQAPAVPAPFLTINAIPISFVEIVPAGRHYPIIFTSGDDGKTFMLMALLGLEAQQNLFALADGSWDPNVYLPAYVRRYPFCMMRFIENGKEARPERVTCVEKSLLDDGGEALFDAAGKPAPIWESYQKLLFEYEKDLMQTEELCSLLAEQQLLEPFSMQAQPNQGPPLQLTGMYRVDLKKLASLDAAKLKDWVDRNVLGCIYAHMFSFDLFQNLLARRAMLMQLAGKIDLSKLN